MFRSGFLLIVFPTSCKWMSSLENSGQLANPCLCDSNSSSPVVDLSDLFAATPLCCGLPWCFGNDSERSV